MGTFAFSNVAVIATYLVSWIETGVEQGWLLSGAQSPETQQRVDADLRRIQA